jgi:diguanylate cyclase (GGDEF)-like protein/PAS domain S-box-containing protein
MFRKDGTLICVEISAKQLPDGSLQGIVRDITERKRAEDQLRQLSSAVEHSPAAILITDVNGNIEYVNPKFTEVTGYILEEVRGKNPRFLKSDNTPPDIYAELWRTILSGKEWRGEFLNRRKSGEFYWEYASISAIADLDGNITHFVAVNEDITSRKEAEEKIQRLNAGLEQLAMTDYLTSLYNRRFFMQRGMEEVKRARRNTQPLSLLMLDIDQLKKVNDTHGHEVGDIVLQQIASTLKSSLRETDILGRMGGEEFAILLPNTALEEACLLADRVRQSIAAKPFEMSGALQAVTVSIGVVVITGKMSGIDDMLRIADAAMYRAKHRGGNRVEQCEDVLNANL